MVDEKEGLENKAIEKTIEDLTFGGKFVAINLFKVLYGAIDYSGVVARRLYNHKKIVGAMDAIGGYIEGSVYSTALQKFLLDPYEGPPIWVKLIPPLLVVARFGHGLYEVNKMSIVRESEPKK